MVNWIKAHACILGIALCLPGAATGEELSKDQIGGKWIYQRIVAEDYTLDVNRYIEFKPDGTVVTYYTPDKELSSATYEVTGRKVIYTDEKGAQHWVVENYDGKALSVDHQGAKMFFERPAN